MASKAHPGFKGAQRQIAAKGGYGMKRAAKILAASTRNASESAKRKNPRLRRVKGAARSSKRTAHRVSRRGSR